MNTLFEVEPGSLASASSLQIVESVVKILDSKKGQEIKVLKIDEKTIIADYFVICTGTSTTQIKTLTDEIEFQLGRGSVPYVKIEGNDSPEWKIVDCHDVIVHIFTGEARDFYKLEKLWADAEELSTNLFLVDDEQSTFEKG